MPNSRIWNSFGERRVDNQEAPIVKLCKMTQEEHLGSSLHTITAKDLVALMNGDEKKRSGIEMGDEWAIEQNTMLRDGLLLRYISSKGGIIIPDHTIVLSDFRDTYWSVTDDADVVLPSGPSGPRFEHSGDVGDSTGSRSFVFIAAKKSQKLNKYADVIINDACRRELLGGSSFWGGLRTYFTNTSNDLKLGVLSGKKVGQRNGYNMWVSTSDLVGMTNINIEGPMVVVP